MMQRFISAWAEWVVEKRWFVIFATLLFFASMFLPYSNLYFDNSNEMWFLPDDPALADYEELRELFGSSQYLMIGFDASDKDSVIDFQHLHAIHELTEFLEDHEIVTKVASLSKYQYIHASDDTLRTDDIIEDMEFLEDTDEKMQRIRTIMAGETLVHDFLITQDLKHTVVIARTIYKKGEIDHHVKLVQDTLQFIKEKKYSEKGFKLHITGIPYISDNFLTTSTSDSQTTFPIMVLLVVILLGISFRSVSGVILPMVVILGSVITIVGVLGFLNWPFNMLNVNLPVLLMTVGIGDSVHILVDFFHHLENRLDAKAAAKKTVNLLFVPCLNTSVTTSIGFLAISSTSLLPLKQFGIVAAIGVFVAFIISVTTLPALLSFLPPMKNSEKKIITTGLIARFTRRIAPFADKKSRIILLLSLLLTFVAVGYTSTIQIDANFVNYFKKDTRIRKDIEYFKDQYHGGMNLEFIIDSGQEDGIKEPAFLKRVLALQNYLEGLEKTGEANSMIDYLRKMNRVMHNDQTDYYRIPETRDLVAQLLFLYTSTGPEEDLSDLMSFDRRYLRLSVKVPNMKTSRMVQQVNEIRTHMKREFPDINARITGDVVLYNNMDHYIHEGLVSSFSIAFLTIILCFFVLFRSIKYGLLAIIPSLLPIVFAGGVMGWMEINLDFATMMVAAITFGIAVDDTIHVITRYIHVRQDGKGRKEAVQLAIEETGRALIFTSIILYFGFSILIMSQFVPNIYFGFFSGLIIILALVADLVLLPAVMLLRKE
jgi:hydrophobe/amphiphile efflux-3 (HAE3) family protein